MDYLDQSATISRCAAYRYDLHRVWDRGLKRCCWIMLNPSTADASEDDPTIRRCIGFTRAWGYGGLVVVNLFALRATNPKQLYEADDPIGPDNTRHLTDAASSLPLTVAAWGVHGKHEERGDEVLHTLRQLGIHVSCLGITKEGHPKHPLYVRGDTQPIAYVYKAK